MKSKFQIYVTEEMKNETIERAENVGCSISDYVRMAIIDKNRKELQHGERTKENK